VTNLVDVESWNLKDLNIDMKIEFTDKPADYVSSELTEFVGKHVSHVRFFKLSPKKTVCLLTFKNGFDVIGYSGCINPDHYRRDIGSKYALKTAVDKASELIAYQEQNKLFAGSTDVQYDTPA
jgi:hypothetical protein